MTPGELGAPRQENVQIEAFLCHAYRGACLLEDCLQAV